MQDWTSCQGSQPESRGYTCGLWMLLHSLAARLPEEGNSGALWLTSVKGFIKNFFQCRWGREREKRRPVADPAQMCVLQGDEGEAGERREAAHAGHP
jgi:hypothetical protein